LVSMTCIPDNSLNKEIVQLIDFKLLPTFLISLSLTFSKKDYCFPFVYLVKVIRSKKIF
jgi:hypothetical protein